MAIEIDEASNEDNERLHDKHYSFHSELCTLIRKYRNSGDLTTYDIIAQLDLVSAIVRRDAISAAFGDVSVW